MVTDPADCGTPSHPSQHGTAGDLMIATARPPLSMMFATIRGWPAARPALESLRDQVAAVGGEIVVMDGSANPPPSRGQVDPLVRWVAHPGWSVFQLRHEGYRE